MSNFYGFTVSDEPPPRPIIRETRQRHGRIGPEVKEVVAFLEQNPNKWVRLHEYSYASDNTETNRRRRYVACRARRTKLESVAKQKLQGKVEVHMTHDEAVHAYVVFARFTLVS